MKALDEIKAALDAAEATYWAEVERIAAKVRDVHVKSFCHYHRVRYAAGMGTWLFSGKAQEATDEAPEKLWGSYEGGDLPPVLEKLLNLPTVSPNTCRGDMVEDYPPDNYQG